MEDTLTRAQMLDLIQRIKDCQGSEEEIDEWLAILDRNLSIPEGYMSGLIFRSFRYGLGDDPIAEEILEKALSYKRIQL